MSLKFSLTWERKTVLYTVLIIIIVVSLMYYLSLFSKTEIGNYLSVISFLFFGVNAILLYFQIKTNLSFNKRKVAFEYSISTIPDKLHPLFAKLVGITKFASANEMFMKYDLMHLLSDSSEEDKKEIRKTVIAIMNFYEQMAIGTYKEVLDNDICYDNIGNNLLTFHVWITRFMVSLQSGYNEERLFVNFDILAITWQKFYDARKHENIEQLNKAKKSQTVVNKNL